MISPEKFRKKPVEIEAVHLTNGVAPDEVASWCGGRVAAHPEQNYTGGAIVIEIDTLEGTMRAEPGDWIIKGVAGEFYPCKPDIFEATYEGAGSTDVSSDAVRCCGRPQNGICVHDVIQPSPGR
ncbi:hypothetical protein [Streptomyces sp. rh34]|uniref:hypothetical protein n=1 Tax=Streptomyces sp. rh34 TaxID=2034272 RepID=UPI001C54D925|nr:hypothetical protein [Streptomyces sp. rh34]